MFQYKKDNINLKLPPINQRQQRQQQNQTKIYKKHIYYANNINKAKLLANQRNKFLINMRNKQSNQGYTEELLKQDKSINNKSNQKSYINSPNNHNSKYSKSKFIDPIRLLGRSSTSNQKTKLQRQSEQYKKLSQLQSNIINQIKNINVHLQSHRAVSKQKQKSRDFAHNSPKKMHLNFIFISQISQMVVQKIHNCIKIQSQASKAIVLGFDIQKFIVDNDGQASIIQAKIVKQVSTVHNKLIDRSVNRIKQYQEKKDSEYEKNYKKDWDLFKRVKTQDGNTGNYLYVNNNGNQNNNYKQSQTETLKNDSRYSGQSKISQLKKSFIQKRQSRSTKLFQSKFTALSKNSYLNEQSFLTKSRNKKQQSKYNSVKTQPSQRHQIQQIVNLTQKDVKSMLKKHKNLISIWIPPASYPQFFGLFAYKIVKLQTKGEVKHVFHRCKLTKYFFYKFSLDRKVFDAILEWATEETEHLIDQLEITLDKTVYNKIFANFGWVLKYWQSHNKIKAIYTKSNK